MDLCVYQSPFLKVDFVGESSLFEMIWLPKTSEMSDYEYKSEFFNYVALLAKLKPDKVIVDTTQMGFPITPELQEWTNEFVFTAALSVSSKKIRAAFLVSNEIVVQTGIEQTMEESEGLKFDTRYFINYQQAKKWILEI